jgi:hypothetical protein
MSTSVKSAATFLRRFSPLAPMDQTSNVPNATKPSRKKYSLHLHRLAMMRLLLPVADHRVAQEDSPEA